jgi:phosphate-selective porin OprO/OprP
VFLSFSVLAEEPATPPATPPPETAPTPPPAPKKDPAWDGSHFYLQSADGNYSFQPYGYVQTDYRIYTGDGVPSNTFTLRRARFGFLGKLEKYYTFAILADFVDINSTLLRDAYVNVNWWNEFQITLGQMVEPFGQEAASFSISNVDFVERGLTSLLYPAASGSFRSPGAMVHGDIAGGVVSYWLGAFNGKGPQAANTTSEPEVLGRLRIYPLKAGDNDWLKGLAIGGAVGHARSRALSNELSFAGTMPEGSFAFFPRLPINGGIMRYNAEMTWTGGPGALRVEYDRLIQNREALFDGYKDLGQVRAWGFNVDATWLVTGEKRPENAPPKGQSPFQGGIGAWELKARYSYLKADAAGDQYSLLRIYKGSVNEISGGVNWYLSSTVKYDADLNVYQMKDAATVGGAPPQTFVVVLQRVQFRF